SLRAPESRRPLPAARCLVPVAGYPLPAGRVVTPDAAHPEVVAALVVPRPIAGNPLNVVAGRLLIRRQLLDGSRRRFGYNRARLRPAVHRFREGLVDRSAGQRFEPLLLSRG